MFLCCLCMHWVLWWGWSFHWEERNSGVVCHLRKADGLQSGYSYDIGERRSVQDVENGPQYWALRHTVHELWWWRRRVTDWSGLISVYWNDWSSRNRIQAGEENLVVNSVKNCRKIQQKRTEMFLLSRAERISFTIRNKTVSALCSDWQADWKGLLRLFSWRWERSLWRTTFSRILDRNGKLEMGR